MVDDRVPDVHPCDVGSIIAPARIKAELLMQREFVCRQRRAVLVMIVDEVCRHPDQFVHKRPAGQEVAPVHGSVPGASIDHHVA